MEGVGNVLATVYVPSGDAHAFHRILHERGVRHWWRRRPARNPELKKHPGCFQCLLLDGEPVDRPMDDWTAYYMEGVCFEN